MDADSSDWAVSKCESQDVERDCQFGSAHLRHAAHCSSMQHMAAKSETPARVSVALNPQEVAALQARANQRDRGLSWMACRAVRFFLQERDRGSEAAIEFERGDRD